LIVHLLSRITRKTILEFLFSRSLETSLTPSIIQTKGGRKANSNKIQLLLREWTFKRKRDILMVNLVVNLFRERKHKTCSFREGGRTELKAEAMMMMYNNSLKKSR